MGTDDTCICVSKLYEGVSCSLLHQHPKTTRKMLLSIHLLLAGIAATSATICKSQSQPNPIAKDRPNEVTGTINGTTAIVPVPYSVARSIVPSQYPILRAAYEKLIPGFPKDMFPAEFEAVQDHDVQSMGIKIPDFSVGDLPIIDMSQYLQWPRGLHYASHSSTD